MLNINGNRHIGWFKYHRVIPYTLSTQLISLVTMVHSFSNKWSHSKATLDILNIVDHLILAQLYVLQTVLIILELVRFYMIVISLDFMTIENNERRQVL